MFKNGDDLRQDILTIQLIYLMDKIWLDKELDLRMHPYKVMGTGCEQGFLEFVQNSETIANIQHEKGVLNTFADSTLYSFIEEKLAERFPDD